MDRFESDFPLGKRDITRLPFYLVKIIELHRMGGTILAIDA